MAKLLEHEMVFDPAKLTEYQTKGVTSAHLVMGKAGNITLLTFDTDALVSEHSAAFDAVVQVIEGQGIFTVGGTPYEVGCGEMIIMPANIPHAVQAKGRMKMMLTMIKG